MSTPDKQQSCAPPDRVLLKFRPDLPVGLRTALIEFGFMWHSTRYNQWVIFAKDRSPPNDSVWKVSLETKMRKIIDGYLDPYAHLGAIKSEVVIMTQGLPKVQKEWCEEWLDNEIDTDNEPPWEDANNFGEC